MGESSTEPLIQLGSIVQSSSDEIEDLLEREPVPCRSLVRVVRWESKILWTLSGASIIVSIFNFMLSLVTQMFCGQLGALELAGASIANVGIQGLAYGIMVNPISLVLYFSNFFHHTASFMFKSVSVHLSGAGFVSCTFFNSKRSCVDHWNLVALHSPY